MAFISTEEGRAVPNGSDYTYQYNLKDHLGNDRLSFYSNSGTATVLQEDEYYSFGLRRGLYDNSNNNRYLYNGKEIQTDLANQYDYGARFYDPVIGRWTSVDPLAEKGRRWSPYNYTFGDPIRFTDPDGMWPDGPPGAGVAKVFNAIEKWWNTPTKFAKDVATGYQVSMGMIPVENENTTNGQAVMWAAATALHSYTSQYNSGSRFSDKSSANTPEVVAEPIVSQRGATTSHEPEAPQGGAYKDLSVKPGEQRHHLVADAVSPVSKGSGPCIVMNTADHIQTGSWGSSKEARAFQSEQLTLIAKGDFEGAMKLGITDVQNKFGTKYDVGIKQAQTYVKKNPPITTQQTTEK